MIHSKTVSRGLILWVGCWRFLSTRVLRLPPFDTMAAALETLSPGRPYLLMDLSGHRSSTFACRRSIDPTPRPEKTITRAAGKPPGLVNHRATVTKDAAPNQRHARYKPTGRSKTESGDARSVVAVDRSTVWSPYRFVKPALFSNSPTMHRSYEQTTRPLITAASKPWTTQDLDREAIIAPLVQQ